MPEWEDMPPIAHLSLLHMDTTILVCRSQVAVLFPCDTVNTTDSSRIAWFPCFFELSLPLSCRPPIEGGRMGLTRALTF